MSAATMTAASWTETCISRSWSAPCVRRSRRRCSFAGAIAALQDTDWRDYATELARRGRERLQAFLEPQESG